MKIHNKLDEILNQKSKVKILRFLFSEKDESTGRGVAGSINMSASTTYEALQEMVKSGILSVRKKGSSKLYQLNDKNYVVKKLLLPLFKKEQSVYSDVVSFIKSRLSRERQGVVSLAIFGSVAMAEDAHSSDLDLLIIAKDNKYKKKLNNLIDKVGIEAAKQFGISLSPYTLTKSEIRIKYARKQAIIESILNANRLIYGEPIERILA